MLVVSRGKSPWIGGGHGRGVSLSMFFGLGLRGLDAIRVFEEGVC